MTARTLILAALVTLGAGAAAANAVQPLDALSPAATDRLEIVLASIAGGNPADLVYRP